jgi:ABC-type transport system involved in cytochrome c biogenesis permease component
MTSVVWTGLVVRRSIRSESNRENSRVVCFGLRVMFPALHRAWSRKRLNRNPIGWLEQRTWTARMLQWGWLAIIIVVYAVIAANLGDWRSRYHFGQGHRLLGWGLLAALGMTAAASFRRERENGILALLLITPLTPNQIVMGRVIGLWAQIRWATVLFVGGWIFLQGVFERWFDYYWMFFFAVSYLTLPVTGLFCSLWRKTYFAAVLWTVVLGIIYPLMLALMWSVALVVLFNTRNFWPTALVVAALVQIGIACVRGRELISKLERRSFSF